MSPGVREEGSDQQRAEDEAESDHGVKWLCGDSDNNNDNNYNIYYSPGWRAAPSPVPAWRPQGSWRRCPDRPGTPPPGRWLQWSIRSHQDMQDTGASSWYTLPSICITLRGVDISLCCKKYRLQEQPKPFVLVQFSAWACLENYVNKRASAAPVIYTFCSAVSQSFEV